MSDAMIVRRGGGSSAAIDGDYAVIGVEYPVGSNCSCAKGSTTLRAQGTGGAAAFNIPESGTWTASCTDGTKSRSKTVSISYAGQVEKVRLNYGMNLLTPEDGLASGYSIGGAGASMSGKKLVLDDMAGTTNGKKSYISPAIDVTDYSRITIKGINTSFVDAYGAAKFAFGETSGSLSYGDEALITFPVDTETTGEEVTLTGNISGLSGSLYLNMNVFRYAMEVLEITLD